jgi:hypothetical protein
MRLTTDVSTRQAWVEHGLPGGWLARARVVTQGSRVVVAELHIRPAGGTTPPGGITWDVSRSAPLGRFGPFVQATASRVAGAGGLSRGIALAFLRMGGLPRVDAIVERPRPRRPTGRDDTYYARLAAEYLGLLGTESPSRRPLRDLAARHGEPLSRMRDRVREARERGLLTFSTPGVRGGELTPRARALLKAAKKPRRPHR